MQPSIRGTIILEADWNGRQFCLTITVNGREWSMEMEEGLFRQLCRDADHGIRVLDLDLYYHSRAVNNITIRNKRGIAEYLRGVLEKYDRERNFTKGLETSN